MSQLFINPDGASFQAQAVLAYLRQYHSIPESWNGTDYSAQPNLARWHNGREQGYVVHLLQHMTHDQINVAWYEDQASDDIIAVAWQQLTRNPPTPETVNTHDPFKMEFEKRHVVKGGQAYVLAKWIYTVLREFWIKGWQLWLDRPDPTDDATTVIFKPFK